MIAHKGTVTLFSENLILRRLTPGDAQAMFENWAGNEKTTRYLSWETHKSAQATKELLISWEERYKNPEFYSWAIETGGTIIGTIGFISLHTEHERCEMGYCIGSKWWNRGIVTEAAGAVIRFAFTELNMNKICARHDTENVGSGRVMQKNGMKREDLLREHKIRKDGSKADMAYYAILKSEWEKIRGIDAAGGPGITDPS